MLVLLFMFIIIIIVIIISSKYINKRINENKYDDIKTNMLMIQAKIKIIKGESDVNQNTDNYLGIKVTEAENQEIASFLKSINVPDEELQYYYILKKEDIDIMGLSDDIKAMEDYSYIVNYNLAEVIYRKGIFLDSTVKYKLSDLLEKVEQKKWILYKRIGVE